MFRSAFTRFLPNSGAMGRYELPAAFVLICAALAPALIPIGILIWSAILHLFLMLFGASGRGFAATFRVNCYAQVAGLAAVVPLCGRLLGGVWMIVLLILGLAAAQRASRGRAALAVFAPTLLFCVCVVIVAFLAGAAIMSSLGKLR